MVTCKLFDQLAHGKGEGVGQQKEGVRGGERFVRWTMDPEPLAVPKGYKTDRRHTLQATGPKRHGGTLLNFLFAPDHRYRTNPDKGTRSQPLPDDGGNLAAGFGMRGGKEEKRRLWCHTNRGSNLVGYLLGGMASEGMLGEGGGVGHSYFLMTTTIETS
jgi:hypothetical protein